MHYALSSQQAGGRRALRADEREGETTREYLDTRSCRGGGQAAALIRSIRPHRSGSGTGRRWSPTARRGHQGRLRRAST